MRILGGNRGQGKTRLKEVQRGTFQRSDQQQPVPVACAYQLLCASGYISTRGSLTAELCLGKVREQPNSYRSQDEKIQEL